jgi:hypothetical protein
VYNPRLQGLGSGVAGCDGSRRLNLRTERTAQRVAYAGRYASRAIPGVWTVAARRDTLWLSVGGGRPLPIEPLFHDAFQSEFGVVRFYRNAHGRVTGFARHYIWGAAPAIRPPTGGPVTSLTLEMTADR